jgi:ElaB/YqjD/DUF883 family membrane-anchored ribosome-binding protein
MNESYKQDTDAIRSDIDVTRRRMDDTMDALSERLQPRHLLDEFLGFFRRSSEGDGQLKQLREKVTHSADTAMHAVVDTVKQNPMPALLIGAGVAWMIYESTRDKSDIYRERRYLNDPEGMRYDPDLHYDRPLDYPPGESKWAEQGSSKFGEMKENLSDKAHEAADTVKDKLSHAGDVAREKAQHMKERAGELGHRVSERTREAYEHTRERVATTAEQHPLELGLVCLAAGVIAGLAMPTPNAVNRSIGPAADRLRERTREAGREMMDKGKHVAEAALHAVKDEAEAQGLTPENLRGKATEVAERGMEAGRETARREGLTPEGNQSGSQLNDPTVARPA